MSHFSSWNSQGLTMTRSPSRIHMRFLSCPGTPPRRLFPSAHMTLILDAPGSWSAIPKISPSLARGRRTRKTSSSGIPPTIEDEGLKRFRGCRLPREVYFRATEGRGGHAHRGHRDVVVRHGRRLEEGRVDDVDPFGEIVLHVVHVAEPVDDRAVPEQLAIGPHLLPDVPLDLVGVAEGRLRLDPVLPGAVHVERIVEEDVRGLVVLRPKSLPRRGGRGAGVEPRVELRLAPAPAGVLTRGPLRGIDDVRADRLVEGPSGGGGVCGPRGPAPPPAR